MISMPVASLYLKPTVPFSTPLMLVSNSPEAVTVSSLTSTVADAFLMPLILSGPTASLPVTPHLPALYERPSFASVNIFVSKLSCPSSSKPEAELPDPLM